MSPPAPTLYLASQSPRRLQLLQQIGVQPTLLVPDADEDAESLEAVRAGESPEAYVRRVTKAKLAAAEQRLAQRGWPQAPVLAADTTVALGDRILGKPADADEAHRMLRALSGRWHRVISGVAVAARGRRFIAINVSRVRLARLAPATVASYVAGGEPFGKAGAYAIQGALAGWISQLEGSYSGVMGLPLHETARLLRRAGVPLALR